MSLRRIIAGQASIEQAMLIVIVALALLGMFKFLTSALSDRAKSGADGIGHGMLYR